MWYKETIHSNSNVRRDGIHNFNFSLSEFQDTKKKQDIDLFFYKF